MVTAIKSRLPQDRSPLTVPRTTRSTGKQTDIGGKSGSAWRRSRIGDDFLGDARGILPQGGEPVGGPCRHRHIVEADDRDVVGHPKARAAQVIERSKCHEIVDAEHRLRRTPVRQQSARGFLPALIV